VRAALLVALGACENPAENEEPPPISFIIVSGDGQTGAVGAELPDVLVVRVTKQIGRATVGVPLHLVNFRVVTGGGSVFAGSALTDLQGYARDYWTLGPDEGENVLEVRSVNPSTGEKRVFARFTADGVVPKPEVCNGLDDDLDGTDDDPSWTYCLAGVPAANTDGINSCTDGYVDLNAVAADGCERLAAGRWTLAPAVTLVCPSLAPGFNSATLTGFDVEVTAPTQLAVKPRLSLGFLGDFLTAFFPPVPVSLVPISETFGGSAVFDFDQEVSPGFSLDAEGAISVGGAFTGPASLQATLNLTLDLSIELDLFPLPFSSTCNDIVDLTIVAAREGS
jgi:hypothetical protein